LQRSFLAISDAFSTLEPALEFVRQLLYNLQCMSPILSRNCLPHTETCVSPTWTNVHQFSVAYCQFPTQNIQSCYLIAILCVFPFSTA
jgi:hypothetical protein